MDASGKPLIGGIQTYLKELAQGLSANHDVCMRFPAKTLGEWLEGRVRYQGIEQAVWMQGGRALPKADSVNIVGTSTLKPKHLSGVSIGIQHGILWDRATESSALWNLFPLLRDSLRVRRYSRLVHAYDHLVCVDLAYPQFVASSNPPLDWDRISYIPNYADMPNKAPRFDAKIKKIVFPRRFVAHRGVDIAIEIATAASRADLEFHFVGTGPLKERIASAVGHKENVRIYSVEYQDRYSIYGADTLVLIPSLSTEGTSLSCLEAWSRGSIVLASSVGGLGNLLLDGVNGFMAKPTRDSFLNAVSEILIAPPAQLARIRKTAYDTLCNGFSQELWLAKWNKTLGEVASNYGKDTTLQLGTVAN
jgi:glycosyltransferase involved in cell wall biosynthesis